SVNQIKNFLTDPKPASKETEATTNSAQIDNNDVVSNKNDKKQIQKTISELSGDRIASISSSCVGGAVPLIVNLSNSGNGKVNKWTFNDGTKPITGANPIKVFDTPGIYTIKLSSMNADGKSAVDSIKIEVTGNSSIHSTSGDFSPNGDGKQDDFSFNAENMVSMSVEVFDVNSNVVYRSESLYAKWDGKNLKGKPVKDGVYYYIQKAEGLDGKKYEQKGKINLTR
ncbi:MAG: T9SS type B sorting domain-containing protein, partial [Bacteroidia bacterium]